MLAFSAFLGTSSRYVSTSSHGGSSMGSEVSTSAGPSVTADQAPSCTLAVALAALSFPFEDHPLGGCCPSLAPPGPWQSWEKCPCFWNLKNSTSFLGFLPLLWDSDD